MVVLEGGILAKDGIAKLKESKSYNLLYLL